ncbi:RHS repeat-associated core domain-containing protein [Streptomyces virginiae]|uniref:RHS repeat-associated core domain-containing protein n=1 Tax=Streptomyces virginiae TaxID=1961 RepID=UPI0036E2544E
MTRNVVSAGGLTTTSKTGDVVLHLTTIQGSVAVQLPLNAGQPPVVLDTDEYDKPRAGQAAARYGWLGGHQRSGETPSGLTLMGARLYNPSTGRFLSSDPVYGGSANAYEYANADPVNQRDLDGRVSTSWRKKIIEANACMSLGWRGCALASAISGMLLATFRSGAKNSAIRHFMWQASLTFYFGARAAKRLGDAHEWGQTGRDTQIDQHNNSVARSFAVRNWWAMLSWYTWGVFWATLYFFARVYYYNGVLWRKWEGNL